MALLDNIIDRIWQAQNAEKKANEAVVQKQVQAVTTGNESTQQKSIKKDVSAQLRTGEEPQRSQVKQNRADTIRQEQASSPYRQIYGAAQREYEAYKGSEENKKNQSEANKRALDEAMRQIFAVPGVSASDAPITKQQVYATADPKERALKAQADYFQNQAILEDNAAVTEKALADYEGWSEEDKKNLDLYIADALSPKSDNPWAFLAPKNPLIEKYGEDTVKRMAEARQRQANEEFANQVVEDTQRRLKENPVSGGIAESAASVGAGLVGALTTPISYLADANLRTGQYKTLDPNTAGGIFNTYSGAVREQVTENIRGDENSWLRNLAAVGYQGGMSALDSAMRMAASGGSAGISAALAASGSFGSALQRYSAQGASPEQAAAMAVVSAGLEYATEKLPTEKVLELFKGGGKKDVIGKVLAQAFLVEPTSEEVNLFAGVAAEAALLGDKNSANLRIGEMVANGMSYQEASAEYWKGLWKEAAETYAVSAISGGMSSGGAAVLGNIVNGRGAQETAEAAPGPDYLEVYGEQLAQQAPQQEVQPVTPEMEQLDMTLAETLGMQLVQQPTVDTTSQATQPLTDDSTVINTDPAQHSPQEQSVIHDYQNAVDDNLVEYIQTVKDNPGQRLPRYPLNNVSDRAAADIQRLTGIDAAGNKTQIEARTVEHILKRHGENGNADHSMRDVNDIGRIQYVIDNYDSMEHGGTTPAYRYQDADGKQVHSQTVLIKKKVNGTYFVVEAVPDTKKKTLYVLSAYMNKNGQKETAPSLVGDAEAYRVTSETKAKSDAVYSDTNVPTNIVSNGDRNVNQNIQSTPTADNQTAVQMGASNAPGQSAEGGQLPKGTGAAEADFSGKSAYNATLSEDNAQADRRDDVRPMELPQQDINSGNVSAVTGNVYGSRITPDDFASLMKEPAARGDFTYAKISNDRATQMATETIASSGTWENAYDHWKQSVTVGNAGAEMSARGALLLNHAAQLGNKQLWLETLHYMQELGTNTAQGLQALRIIRTLSAPDKIAFARMSVEKMAADIKKKYGIDLEIDQTLIDEFEQAETDEERDAILLDIQQNVADQIPSTFLDKWTALRYMNMLGNLKTNVRNVAGNIGSAAVYRIKDTIATGMESIASKLSGGSTERTKSLFVRKSLLNACKEDFQQFKETVGSGGKYGERMSATGQFEQGVQDKRRIFKNSALEAYRKGTNWMMNNELFGDEAFGRAAYSRALAGYLQANGVTGSDLSEVDSALLDKARAYAVKEAQEATFHDNSALAEIVSNVQKATGVIGQGIMPFTKTPANVLTRAEEFSPLGLINSTVKSIQKARGNENVTGADVINSWAKSVTGVGLFALGAAMMDQGLLTGGPDEDEEKAEFDELNGQQNYAIQLPDGTNYTIDWLTPAAMPMFMGAQFWKMLSSDRDLTFADMEQVFTSIADPMIQMSMLQGLNDSLDGIKYSDNNLGRFFINAAVSYLTQGLSNTLMGQLERSTEENRQTTYIDKNSATPEWLQRQLGKASQKIPGWDYQQMDYRNAWGQTEKNEGGLLYNMLSPGYVSKEQNNRITQELYRLRETTGENVFPQAVEKTITYTDVNGTKYVNRALTQTELDSIQRVEGQTAMRLMAEIVMNEDYNRLTDDQRAAVIANVYKYAQEQGKKETLSGYYSEAAAWLQNIGNDAANGLIQRAALSTINSSVTKIVDNIENEWAVSPAAQQELDSLYDSYAGMSKEARKRILDEAISDTAKYLEIRSKGLDTAKYLDVVGDIKSLVVEPNFSDIRDIQIREAIAENDSLSTREKDIVMRAYMPDYDPTAKSPQKAELKYDAVRELGVSPEGYTDAYRDYLDASGTGKRSRTIAYYMKTYGWDRSTAQKVYDIYAGYYEPWEE